MIRNWSIRNRVLLLALLPVICLGVLLGSYFVHSRVHDLKAAQATLGRTTADQLASASLYGALTHNAQSLHALAESGLREPNVQSVIITGSNGQVLAEVNRPMQPGHGFTNVLARSIGAETGFKGALEFTRPILQERPGGDAIPSDVRRLGSVTVKLSEVHFAERQADIILSGGLILIVCLVFSILLALLISGSVVTPIGRIIGMVQRFSSGDHAVRAPERSGGELGQLERGINHMAADAQRSQQELQDQVDQATAELRGTLEEFEIKSVELDLARKRALEASRVKSEFLANMSHEIRTPMNAVLGFSELLTDTPLNDGQRDYLATLRKSAHALLALLDNVLAASRLEMGASDIHNTGFVLRELLEDRLQIHALDAYAKQIELVLDTDGTDSRPLFGDRTKLMRILANLINNAIKFTDTGTVVLRCRCTPKADGKVGLALEVRDTGIGISEPDQHRLFQPFFQTRSSSDRRHEGAGLGLYISKRLVNQLGGTLTLHSVPGKGSEFRLRLAFAPDPNSAATHTVPAPVRPPRKPLLAYEPNPQAAKALQARLARLGWDAHVAGSLQQLSECPGIRGAAHSHAALLLALSYADLADPQHLARGLPERAQPLPRLALINSVNAKRQADVARCLHARCLSKSVSEAQLGRELEQMIAGKAETLPTRAPPATPFLEGHSIVVVDDNRINRLLERIVLEKYGARVLEVRSGRELTTVMAQNHVSLILLDMHMPGEDGWQIAAKLQSSHASRHANEPAIPVIALSAMSCDKSSVELAAAGLSGWMMKPLEEAALQKIVTRYLHGASSATRKTPRAVANPVTLDDAINRLRPALRQMLREDLPAELHAIQTAWDNQEMDKLHQQVHKLNGSAAFCRLADLREVCTKLENQLRKGNMQALPERIAQLTEEIVGVMARLEQPELSRDLSS